MAVSSLQPCAMSSQRVPPQDQINIHEVVKQKIRSLLYAQPADVENNQDKARLRQRRPKGLICVFQRDVTAVLAANRLGDLAQSSCSLFTWINGLKGGTGSRVCVGESKHKHNLPVHEEEEIDCFEHSAGFLANFHAAIISSMTELQNVVNKPKSWLCGRLQVGAARNSFSEIMDKMNVIMGTVPLIHRSAPLVWRKAPHLECGLCGRLSSMKNEASLQKPIFEFTGRLHAARMEHHSLHLQLAKFK